MGDDDGRRRWATAMGDGVDVAVDFEVNVNVNVVSTFGVDPDMHALFLLRVRAAD